MEILEVVKMKEKINNVCIECNLLLENKDFNICYQSHLDDVAFSLFINSREDSFEEYRSGVKFIIGIDMKKEQYEEAINIVLNYLKDKND